MLLTPRMPEPRRGLELYWMLYWMLYCTAQAVSHEVIYGLGSSLLVIVLVFLASLHLPMLLN